KHNCQAAASFLDTEPCLPSSRTPWQRVPAQVRPRQPCRRDHVVSLGDLVRSSVPFLGSAVRPRDANAAPKMRLLRAWRPLLALLLSGAIVVPQRPAQADVSSAPDAENLPLRVWHFAEGNSRNGFETYFTLRNLTDQPASVMVNYNRDDGI